LGLFASGITSLIGLERQSNGLLLLGQLLGSVLFGVIVVLESLSLWAMPYLE
jgi:hypothetical protein